MQCLLQLIHPTKTRRHVESIHNRFFLITFEQYVLATSRSTLVSPTVVLKPFWVGRRDLQGKSISLLDRLILTLKGKNHRFGVKESISLPPSCISNVTISWYPSGCCFCCYYCFVCLFIFTLPITYIKDNTVLRQTFQLPDGFCLPRPP